MRRRLRPQPEVPWWLRPIDPHARSAPPLSPDAVRHLQEEEKRKTAHMETMHKTCAPQSPSEENVANNDNTPSPPAPAAPAPSLVAGQAPQAAP
ncbi:MAG TPA: hypothetical protein VG488_00365, partial [Candidatus Angelobacter sp.]|nr:hypothetical protein [Candidatus Angelobacter sp.]